MDAQSLLETTERFLNSGTLDLILKAILLYIALLWVALIIWVTKDITNRTNNLSFQVGAILLIILGTPIFGLLIYLIIRPSKTLMDSYYEDLEAEVLEQEAVIMQLQLAQSKKDHPALHKSLAEEKEHKEHAPRSRKKPPKPKPAPKVKTPKEEGTEETSPSPEEEQQ